MNDPQSAISLTSGWNWVAYYPDYSLPVKDSLGSCAFCSIDANLLLAKDDQGGFYEPEADFSNMQPLFAGKGYAVKVNSNCSLVYPRKEQDRQRQKAADLDDRPLSKRIPNTGVNMSLLIQRGDSLNLLPEDELYAISSHGLVVGGAFYSPAGFIGMAIWGDDPTTESVDGAVEGEPISFRIHRESQDLAVFVRGIRGNTTYGTDSFSWIEFVHASPLMPLEFALSAPYPNPFNGVTVLRYSLSKSGKITLRVFDIAGRAATTLVDGEREAGVHQTTWKSGDASSGLYFARLEAGGEVKTQKMMLIK
jgi:hypothetical protein